MKKVLLAVLVLLSTLMLVWVADSSDEYMTLFRDDFAAGKLGRDWRPTRRGTGIMTLRDGYLCLNISDKSNKYDVSAALLESLQTYSYGGMEVRLRCSDDNKLESDIGGGFRRWGFWETHWPENYLAFESLSPESEPDWVGFYAAWRVNGGPFVKKPLTGIDMRDWHNYTILWGEDNGTFLVDGEVVATTEKTPSVPMYHCLLLNNLAFHRTEIPGETWDYELLDVPFNVSLQVDYVHIFGAPEATLPSILGLILLPTLLRHR